MATRSSCGAVERVLGNAAGEGLACPRPSRRSATCSAPPARSRRSSRCSPSATTSRRRPSISTIPRSRRRSTSFRTSRKQKADRRRAVQFLRLRRHQRLAGLPPSRRDGGRSRFRHNRCYSRVSVGSVGCCDRHRHGRMTERHRSETSPARRRHPVGPSCVGGRVAPKSPREAAAARTRCRRRRRARARPATRSSWSSISS